MAGGTVAGTLIVSNSATALVSGGVIESTFATVNSASAIITGFAAVDGNVEAFQQSTIIISGADLFGNVFAFNNARIVLNGKLITGSQPSVLNAAAGESNELPPLKPADQSAFPAIYLSDDSTLEFDGHVLSADLIDPLNSDGAFSEYEITGLYPDGTPIPAGLDIFVDNTSTASIQLVEVPEPASATLMFIAAIGALVAVRKNKA